MKRLQFLGIVAALSWATSVAWAQMSLSGSSGVVRLPPVDSGVPVDTQYSGYGYAPYVVSPAEVGPVASASFSQGLFPGHMTQAVPRSVSPPVEVATVPSPPRPLVRDPWVHEPQPELVAQRPPGLAERTLGESGRNSLSPWEPAPTCEPGPEYDSGYAYGPSWADGRGSPLTCLPPKWYVSVSALLMAREDRPNKVWVTHEADDENNLLMRTENDLEWRAGGEIRFGRHFGGGAWAVEAAYWTLDPFTSVASQTHPDFVSTPLDFTDVDWADPGLPGSPANLFDTAEEHRLWRRNEVHNIELAVIRDRVDDLCWGPFQLGCTAGIRYFRFEEDLRFGSMDQDGLGFGIDPAMEAYLDDKITNHLVGLQFGWRLDYCRDRWRLYVFPRVGIYNNHIRNRFNAYRGDGELLAPVLAGYPPYPVSSTKDVFVVLSEIDLGLEWQFSANWSATIDYRVTVATGMGLADHQIPFYVADTPDAADIDSNGHLLLHGARAGVTYQF